jgi:predicted nucleic acid-binding Zn ribbon protein
MHPGSFFHPVSDVLSRVAHKLGLETRLLEVQLKRRWAEIVGEQIAAHTRPDQIRFKKLSVVVENSVWLQQLTFLKPELLDKINGVADRDIVTEITLRVGEIRVLAGGKTEQAHETGGPATPDDAALREAAAHAASVTDPDLRDRLTEVMANALASRADRHRKQSP